MSTINMKNHILYQLKQVISSLGIEGTKLKLDQSKRPELGDLSCGIALSLSKMTKKTPMELAEKIKDNLILDTGICSEVTISKPGFLNFRISIDYIYNQLKVISIEGSDYGKTHRGLGYKAQVEFVSANPTGPLTVGHGRQAVLGDVVSRILEWHGYNVEREYYYNDAGRQMRLLGESVQARYLELSGLETEFPEGGYKGEYIRQIARNIIDADNSSILPLL